MAILSANQLRQNQEAKLRRQKQQLRKKLLRKRAQQPPTVRKEKSAQIAQRLLNWPGLEQVQNIFCYLSAAGEVETQPLLKELLARGKSLAVPQIIGPGEMRPVSLTNLEKIVTGPFKIPVPKIINPFTEKIELNLVPAVAVDKQGRRLGQGGGYYDRFIEEYQPNHNLALVFEFQLLELVPVGPFDKLMDTVITEQHIYHVVSAKSSSTSTN